MQRLTFGLPSLLEGINVSILAMGIFGVGEILRNLEESDAPAGDQRGDRPPLAEPRRSCGARPARSLRGTALGSVLGILPGSGTLLAPFASYVLEKKISRIPSASARARRKASRARRPPTTPRRRPASSRC